MGKEAKIGLSIIGILVIIFAVVLGQRMLGSKDESPIAKNHKKASQSKNKKTLGSKRFPVATKSNSSREPTSALALSGTSAGTSGVSGASNEAWPYRQDSSSAYLSPPMPTPTGSTTLPVQQTTGASYPDSSSNAYLKDDISSAETSPASSPGAGSYGSSSASYGSGYSGSSSDYASSGARSDGQGQSSRSSYRSDRSKYPPQNNRFAATSGSSYGTSRAKDSYERAPVAPRTGSARSSNGHASSYSNERAPIAPRTGSARSSNGHASSYSNERATASGGHGASDRSDSRYHSASYESSNYKKYDPSSYDSSSYGSSPSYGSSLSDSNYGGGSQPDGTYIVKPLQNYWEISKDVYGTGAYFKALAEANRSSIPDENRLKVGDRIKTPELAKLEQTYPELCPSPKRRDTMRKRAELASSNPPYGGSGRQYIVQSGDTLYDIARFELGDAARWTEIYEQNRQVLGDSFDYLTPGLKLTMPSKEKKSVAAAPKTTYGSPPRYGSTPSYGGSRSSNYGESRSQYQRSYETEAPRTASLPGYGTSRAASQQPSSNYGGNSGYNGSSYDKSQHQPSRITYPRK